LSYVGLLQVSLPTVRLSIRRVEEDARRSTVLPNTSKLLTKFPLPKKYVEVSDSALAFFGIVEKLFTSNIIGDKSEPKTDRSTDRDIAASRTHGMEIKREDGMNEPAAFSAGESETRH
jgi:hypothetical protein